MSAMVGNPDELSEWLASIHIADSSPIQINWRPSRTLRGLLAVDENALGPNLEIAKEGFNELPEFRVNNPFSTPLALIAGLSGPWTLDGPSDYRISRIGIDFEAVAEKDERDAKFESWKNTASRLLSVSLASHKIPVICFILSSKHHAFSSADKVEEVLIEDEPPFEVPEIVEAWLDLADEELGVETIFRELFARGIAVHTSALLTSEHAASEAMFLNGLCPLMFATVTLAQGLNLPAVAVVIAGTTIGDSRKDNIDGISGVSRVDTLILNGFGRAGRPGFSNQGIGILVGDKPFFTEVADDLDPRSAIEDYPVLRQTDVSFVIDSPVETFLDRVLAGELDLDTALPSELTLTSLLAESDSDEHNAGKVLSKTLAAYRMRDDLGAAEFQYARERIQRLKEIFLEQENVPNWISSAAMRSGVDFFRALRIWTAYESYGIITDHPEHANLGIMDWFNVFIEVISRLPPKRVREILPHDDVKTETVLTRMRDLVKNQLDDDLIPWDQPADWSPSWHELGSLVSSFMNGETYATLAREYLGIEGEIRNIRSSGSHPIPAILKFVKNTVDRLSIDAGCLLAIQELLMAERHGQEAFISDELKSLPLCIRNGCNSIGALSWFRFGYRQRIIAHRLNAILPIPLDVLDDVQRMEWVSRTRSEWLLQGPEEGEDRVLGSIRAILTSDAN